MLAACGQDGSSDGAGSTTTETVTETVTAAEATVTETVTAEENAAPQETSDEGSESGEASEGEANFGDTWTWEDGTKVTVSKPAEFTPSNTSAGGEGFDQHVKFEITVENTTGEPLDLGLFTMTIQSGRSEGGEVFDSAKGMEGSPMTRLLDGRSVDFSAAFGVDDPEDLVLEVMPSFESSSAIYTS